MPCRRPMAMSDAERVQPVGCGPNSIHPMRKFRVGLAAAFAAGAVMVSGCGVAAPKSVANVDGVKVSMEDVNTVARDPLSQLVPEGADEFSLPGDAARNALMFEVTRAAWVAEAQRWGLDPDSVRDEAEKDLDQRLAASQDVKLSDHMRDAYVDSTAARIVLEDRFSKLDPNNDADLRKIFDLSPGLWDRTCAWILSVPEGSQNKVEKFADKGTGFEERAKKVKGTAVQAKPKDGCRSRSSLPEDIANGINSLRINETELFNFEISGQKATFLVKVVSRENLSFDKARTDVAQIADALRQQGPQVWISTRVAEAKIDPRFASGVSMDSSGQATLSPPVGPFQPKGTATISSVGGTDQG